MKTRHLIIWLGCLLLALQSVWAENKFYIPETTKCPIGKTTEVPVWLDNTDAIVGMQFELELVYDGYTGSAPNVKDMELTDRKSEHVLTVNPSSGSHVKGVIYSAANNFFSGNSGALLRFKLELPENAELVGKKINAKFTNITLSKGRQATPVRLPDLTCPIEIVDNNRPNFTVGDVKFTSTAAVQPGGEVKVSWVVKNTGKASTKAGWKESLFLTDGEETDIYLGEYNNTTILAAGASASRTETVKLSDYPGVDGAVYAKVVLMPYADSGELETDKQDNEEKSAQTVSVAKKLTLNISKKTIEENSQSPVQCYLYRSGKRTVEESFTLEGLYQTETVRLKLSPSSLTIPAGQSGAMFTIEAVDNNVANWDSTAVVVAKGNGYPEVKETIRIEDDERPYIRISLNKEEVTEGDEVSLTVEREWKVEWPLTVRLFSDHPKRFENFPSEVMIPVGEKTKEINIKVKDDDLTGLDDQVVFTASAPGHAFDLTSKRFITIKDNDVPNITLELSTSSASEANQVVTATLKRTGVTDNKVTVNLTDNGNGRISLPSSIVLEAGVAEKEFAIKTIDNTMKDGDVTITIKGMIYISSCNCSTAGTGAGVFEKQLTVLDDDNALVKCVASKTTLLEGETGKITVSVNEVLKEALQVMLASDNKDLKLESPVTIPAGKSSVEAKVEASSNSTSEGNRVATVVIDAGKYGKSTCWLNITDQTLPDAVITTVKATDKVAVQASASVSVTIKNEGAIALPAQTKVAVYLSSENKLTGSAIALGTLYTQNELAVGESVELEKKFTFPDKTGDYYLIAVVNEEQSKKELSYINNTSSPFTLALTPLYTVQVSLDKSVIKTGESVMVTGQVTGSPATGVPVDLYIINSGYRKVIRVKTDNSGVFQQSFTPESWQLGHFSVGACYPDEGLDKEMAGFDLFGLKKASAGVITWEVFSNEKTTGSIKLSNPGNKALSNITVKIISQPQNCTIKFASISSLAANGTAELQYDVTGTAISLGADWEPIKVQVTSAEGAVLELDIYYYCRSQAAQLEVSEPNLNTTMTIGAVREYPITITNTGKGETGEIKVALPDVDWLSLASPVKMPSLKYGESATVLLRLAPKANMETNLAHKGQFAINCANGKGVPVSFRITPVSSEKGTLVVDVCDEYTYYTAEKPHVNGAKVRITRTNTNEVVAEGITGSNGLFTHNELPVGYYTLEVTADKHDSYKNTVLVDPGKEKKMVVNLSFQAITYSWTVEETTVEDEYEIKTNVKYETNVPVPVVIADIPKAITVNEMENGESCVFNMVLTNKGLITAKNITISFPAKIDYLNFEILTNNSVDIAPQEAVIIPIKVTKKNLQTRAINESVRDFICKLPIVYDWGWICGEDLKWKFEKVEINLQKELNIKCDKNNIDEKGEIIGPTLTEEQLIILLQARDNILLPALAQLNRLPYIEGIIQLPHPEVKDIKLDCHPCVNYYHKKWVDCLISFIPVAGDVYGVAQCVKASADATTAHKKMSGWDMTGCALTLAGLGLSTCSGSAIVATIVAPGAAPVTVTAAAFCEGLSFLLNIIACEISFLEPCPYGKTKAIGDETPSYIQDYQDKLKYASDELEAIYRYVREYFGSDRWLSCPLDELTVFLKNMNQFKGVSLSQIDEQKVLEIKPNAMSLDECLMFIDRLNNTDIIEQGGVVDGNNYISRSEIFACLEKIDLGEDFAVGVGYLSMAEMIVKESAKFDKQINESAQSICSSISLQFSQSMAMTRQAFRGTLTVQNGHESTAMQNVKLDLIVSDEEGIIATSHEIQISPEKLEGFGGDLDEAWTLDAQKTGKATVLFIPTKYAAPTEPKEYTFGGTLSYIDPFTGLEVIRDLFPATLTVKPSPNLEMDYFMQRDILGDDPLTEDVVEPIIPSEFSLLIHNGGAGDATNVRMNTKQPEITDNEKGLLVDFQIKTSQLNGEAETAVMGENVMTDIGTIRSGKTAYAQWWLTSSFLGHFTDYKVEATHVTSYDNPDLSLLDTVRIHELIRGIRVNESANPKITGFMVNDIPDAEDFPDMMYLTDGSVAPVVKAANATCNEDGFNYTLAVTPSAKGWNYISIPDPTNGKQKLISVDGNTNLDTRKVWQTDRTLRDGKDPKYEYLIHVVDYFEDGATKASSPGTFRLVFEKRPETILAIESIAGLPEDDNVATTPVGIVTIKFNKDVSPEALTGEMVTLYCQGEKVDTKGLLFKQQGDTYTLDLSTLTSQNGLYTLTILTSKIKDAEGFTGDEDYSVVWTQLAGGKVSLTAQADPEKAGTVTPASVKVDYGKDTEFKATAKSGYQFKNWTINDQTVSTEATYLHTAIVDQSIIANFAPIPYKIEISYNAAQGFVSFGTGYYDYDSSLELIATPNDGYRFIGWFIGNDLVSSKELLVYRVGGEAKLEARFQSLNGSTDPDNPGGPNNPNDPDDPNNPDNPTANEDLESIVIHVYPTRVTDYVHIGILPAKSSLILFNIAGKQLKQISSCEGDVDLFMGDQPSGIYLLYILAGEERKQTVKLIKK